MSEENSTLLRAGHLVRKDGGSGEETAFLLPSGAPLTEVIAALSKGAETIAVYDDPANKNGYRGTIRREDLAESLAEITRVTEARLLGILESSFDAVCMIDNREQVALWNDQAENLYRIKRGKILGKDINLFFDNLVVTKVLRSGEPVRGAYHQPCPGTYVLINAFPVLLNGTNIGSVSVERDITNMVTLNRELIKANKRASVLEQEIEKYSHHRDPFDEISSHSERFREVIRLARKVAATDAAVLLCGESGTGKEVVAQALHRGGGRRDKPFVPLNCGAIPYNLFESEMFGYEGGAFTGAEKKGKPGKFALAHGGTLFLDEISELHPELQVKLLRVLQDQVYYPVGGSVPKRVDVRIIAATNQDLEALVRNRQFRKDLYYRLNVVTLNIPPLRERKNDIPELAYKFMAEYAALYQKQVADIDTAVITFFFHHHWGGNIRELRNVIERMVVFAEGERLTIDTLPAELRRKRPASDDTSMENQLTRVKGNLEREMIIEALIDARGNKAAAAALLELPRSSLYYRINKLGITEKDYRR